MSDIPAVVAPPQEKPSNSFSRMIGVLVSPGRTYAEIVRKPDWVIPAIVLVVMSFVALGVMMPRIDFESTYREAFEAQHIPPEQQEQPLRWAVAFGRAMMYISPLFALGGLAVAAAIYFLGVRLFGGVGTYGEAFSVVLYGWMPRVVKAIITIPVLLTKHTLRLQEIETVLRSNLGFLTDVKEHPVLFSLLAGLDIFTVWSLVLIVIGLAAMSKLSKAKTAVIVVVVWGLGLLLRVGGAALGALRAAR